ncbi:MAG: signal peptidase II, partial [Thermoanaerobaculia bacterium]
DRRLLTSLALILGGAVGNLIDRMANGEVTDFIDVYFGAYHWHTFNVADSAITVGIALMALDIFLARNRRRAVPETERS